MASLQDFIDRFRAGTDAEEAECSALLDCLINASDENKLRDLFTAWDAKGISESELFGIASEMRGRCTPVKTRHAAFVDTVGTGGSSVKTFNVSTAAAFVIAGAGVPVGKHGNKAATSNSGSADVLSELGVNPSVDAATAERLLNDVGICFMFAPNFHRLSPILASVRRELGVPTIFNNLGPLCNPAAAPHQLLGVWDRARLDQTASVLTRLGTKRSWIVCGHGGLDEIALDGPTEVADVTNGKTDRFEIGPSEFGLRQGSTEHLRIRSAVESALMVRGVLSNSIDGVAKDLVIINSAAAIYISGRCDDLKDSAAAARESLESGAALRKLEQLAAETNI